jgi:phospholipid-transporting ATPase
MALHDDDDNLQLLTNRGQIAGRYDRNGTNPSLGGTVDSSNGGIPLHRPASRQQPNNNSKKKKFNFKDTINKMLGKSNAASGNAGEGGERIIHVNNSELNAQQKFLHNRVFTAKYTAFNFIFKFLFEEFSKYANLFFLFISGIQVSDVNHEYS